MGVWIRLGLWSLVFLSKASLALEPTHSLRRLSSLEIPEFKMDDSDSPGNENAGSRELLKLALQRQRGLCGLLSDYWDFAGIRVSKESWCRDTIDWFLGAIESGATLDQIYLRARQDLEWFESTGKPETGKVHFTGYFFPVYPARSIPDDVYRYPVYRAPPDLVRPYFTREEIETRGVIRGKGLEIAYLDNPIDPYILQVQGSGAFVLEGGRDRMIVNYASENGRPYSSLGKAMREAGIDERFISLQGIKEYFTHERPDLWQRFSNLNQSYVFFKIDQEGPFGYSGAILTPKHSIAVDKTIFPMGAVGIIQTERPEINSGGEGLVWKTFSQFVVTQDTGGAIRSPGRVDVFWGEGPYAELAAGKTDRTGKLIFFLPKRACGVMNAP